MYDLDINTKKGQVALRHESRMLDTINRAMCLKHNNNSFLIETDKSSDARIDGMIVKDNKVSGIFESKCRNMSLSELKRFDSWLITLDKIMDGKRLSVMLRAPFFGFLYLIKDDMVMFWKITDKFGDFLFDFDVRRTSTRKTINGGTALRTNAYLPFKNGAKIS
jgi:hypothetical protein